MVNICKYFEDVRANHNINLKVMQGEIYALLGENGAGKSTLMNILSGIYSPTHGKIYIHGKPKSLSTPQQSIANGIGMIHQHFKLVDSLTAAENIVLGQKISPFISQKKLNKEITELAEKFDFSINPGKLIYDMSVSEKQTVEILKVLYRGADILILDEPTAVLTPQETQKLFAVLRKMKKNGCAVIIITHKLNEVLEISDWVTVMRKGETIGSVRTSETTASELTNMMVGETVNLSIDRPYAEVIHGVMRINNLTVVDKNNVTILNHIDFHLRGGEILGVAGVSGSGQKELCEALSGLQTLDAGEIIYKGQNLAGLSPRAISESGVFMAFIPEDRLGMGLVGNMDMVDNMILKNYYQQPGILISRKAATEQAGNLVTKLNIQTPSVNHAVKKMSGGNIQKVLLGREIDNEPSVIITAYATRGLDIGASHVIYDLLNKEKQKGVAILYFGEDLDVLLELSDRIMVLSTGNIAGIVKPKNTSKEDLGLMMSGAKTVQQEDWV